MYDLVVMLVGCREPKQCQCNANMARGTPPAFSRVGR